MNKLKIKLENCYGIQLLNEEFDFTSTPNKPKIKSYAVYAPNGLMKTSFTKTFDALAKGELPKEERYNRTSLYEVLSDNNTLPKENIYVLKSEIDISSDSPAISNILVNPENKARYDAILSQFDELKNKLVTSLSKLSKIKKNEIEQAILNDWNVRDFAICIGIIEESTNATTNDLSSYEYATIFDPKTIEVFKSQEFISKAREFNERYQELFDQEGTIYKKGIFNPAKADISFKTLKNHGFFECGHRVHLQGETESIDQTTLEQKVNMIHEKIDGDKELKKLRANLAKNAQTQALTTLIETLSGAQVKYLLFWLEPDNQAEFRKNLWIYYIQNNIEAKFFLDFYAESKDEIKRIEDAAAQAAPRWLEAIELFNDRFVDMPFTLSIANQSQAVLGKEQAKLKFTFEDGSDRVECSRNEIKTLSQGEKRALYLLNFIFEVEARKLANQESLFIIDDIADSFDYKNKHAIVHYLRDISNIENFHQIILTHNFDFFRSLATSFVHRERCLMVNRNSSSVTFAKAEGINNYFINIWKNKVDNDDSILCATIPFTRNLLEYTKGENDVDYLKLTSLLHWKEDTDQITVGDYMDIYNRLFGKSYDSINSNKLINILFSKAREICECPTHDGLNLENKVLLSIAIRMQAEIFLTNELRTLKNDPNSWCQTNNQFGKLIKEYSSFQPHNPSLRILEKVSITVSSNIHLNSFMYEPILDLTIEHLINLYNEVYDLNI